MHFLTHLRGRHAHNVPPLPELLAFAHDAQVLARLRRIAYDGKRERQGAAARPIAVSAPAKGLQRPPSHGAPPKRRGLRLHVGAVRSVRRTRHEEQDGEDKSSLRRALSAWSSHRKGADTKWFEKGGVLALGREGVHGKSLLAEFQSSGAPSSLNGKMQAFTVPCGRSHNRPITDGKCLTEQLHSRP